MNERALSLINDTWPIVVISSIVAISLRLTYLKLAKRKINYADEFLKWFSSFTSYAFSR